MTGVPTFEAFAAEVLPSLSRAAVLLLSGENLLVDDVVQSALVTVYVRWARVSRMTSPSGYAYRVLVNEVRQAHRHRGRERPVGSRDRDLDPTDRWVNREVVLGSLRLLPPKQREVLVLRYLADMSEADTARAVGCSVGTVKSQSHRGLKALRAALEEQERIHD